MPDIETMIEWELKKSLKKNDEKQETTVRQLTLLDKFDEQTILQAVVMSEILGKPKAKRRKR